MTLMLDKNLKQNLKTSAGEKTEIYVLRPSIVFSGTNAGRNIVKEDFFSMVTTSGGISIESTCDPETTQKSLSQLRKLSGLTWDQLAKLF